MSEREGFFARRQRALAGIPRDGVAVADEPDEKVWVSVGAGRKRLVAKSTAIAEGWEFEATGTRKASDWIPRSNTYRLSTDEKRKIYFQTGVHVEDYAHYKAVCREYGWRDEEKGERGREKKDLIREWAASGAQGECPAGRHGLEVKPRERASRLDDYIRYREANTPRDSD